MADKAAGQFADHHIDDAPSYSFRFRVPFVDGQPATHSRSFTLTWIPGQLFLTGYYGNLTLSHPQSAHRFGDAMEWVVDADYHYLMGKSDQPKQYDPDKTLARIVAEANLPVIDDLKWHRSQLSHEKDPGEIERIRAESPRNWPARAAERKHQPGYRRPEDVLHVPECWTGWLDIWNHFEGGFDRTTVETDHDTGPKSVMTHAGRDRLKRDLQSVCQDEYQVTEFLKEMGSDGYYGSQSYPEFSRDQIAAIKFACKAIRTKVADDITEVA